MEAEPQDARAKAARDTSRNRKRRRSAEDIVRIVSEREAGRDNWTVGQNWCRGEGVYSCQLRGGGEPKSQRPTTEGPEIAEKKVEKANPRPTLKKRGWGTREEQRLYHRGRGGVRR